jgi:hypothetical protein
MRAWRRTTGGGFGAGAAVALGLAAFLGNIPGAGAQLVTPECTFDNDDVDEAVVEDGSGLFNAIAAALGIDPAEVVIPILIVPTFNEKLGQVDDDTFSELVICRNTDEIPDGFATTTESDRFPSGTDTADLLEIEQTSYILIELIDGERRLRICQTGRTTNECIVATQPAPEPEP